MPIYSNKIWESCFVYGIIREEAGETTNSTVQMDSFTKYNFFFLN